MMTVVALIMNQLEIALLGLVLVNMTGVKDKR